MDVTVQDMMQARDRRAEKQRQMLARHGRCLLCFTMNIPGPEKDNALIRQGFALGQRRLEQGFSRLGAEPVERETVLAFTGCEGYYALPLEPLEAKRMAADIEEYDPLGRLFDMDVLRPDGSKVERREVGLPERKCLICGGEARACARSRTHSVAELRERTDAILRAAVREQEIADIARLASQALLDEVLTTPKPGLVDRANSGSHRDMDIFTFAASAAALRPYFERCARLGQETADEPPQAAFAALRLPGRVAEGEMLEATAGVNTHRGAVFSLGVLCAAAGRVGRENWRMEALTDACAALTEGLTARDFEGLTPQTARTFGQRLYLAEGIAGVRGEAEQGFPTARLYGCPKLKAGLAAGLSLNDAGRAALLAIMAHNTDTNVIHRGGMDAQRRVSARAAELLAREPFPGEAALAALDAELIRENISPGGSADLLSLCYLLYSLEEASA